MKEIGKKFHRKQLSRILSSGKRKVSNKLQDCLQERWKVSEQAGNTKTKDYRDQEVKLANCQQTCKKQLSLSQECKQIIVMKTSLQIAGLLTKCNKVGEQANCMKARNEQNKKSI